MPSGVGTTTLTTLRALFINSAGGCTETEGKGWWAAFEGGKYVSEPVTIFDIAGLPWVAVRRAAEIVLAAGQTDVYVETGSGNVVWFNQADDAQSAP